MNSIYIFGHQKPDTDSITSSISLAYLKKSLGLNAIACRLGDLNEESKYVLNTFGLKQPQLLDDVKLQIKDLTYHKNYFINFHKSIKDAYDFMLERSITGVPVVDDNNKLISLITLKIMVRDMISGDINKLDTSYQNIINTLEAEEILKFDDEIKGNIIAASYRSTTFMDSIKLDKDNILIVGDRHSVIEYAINSCVKLIIVVGNNEIKQEHLEMAKKNKVNVIRTGFDTFKTTKMIGLSNYIVNIIPDDDIYTFNEEDYYDEFVIKTTKLKHNNYPVVGKNGICKGLIRITDITEKRRKKVILVDHNEARQSVEGLEEAEIVEIVDHHKIDNISTNTPINFRNMSVGSTNTIIYEMYKENNIAIPTMIAGCMLAGILSDTLILTSPTTTELDKIAVNALADICKIDYQKFALDMFKVGTSLKNKTVEEIINSDIKVFNSDNITFAISQVFTLDIDTILSNKDKYIEYINKLASDRNYRLVLVVITDIIRKGSYFIYTDGSKDILMDAFNLLDIEEFIYIDDIMSRKKQIVPKLMEVMR